MSQIPPSADDNLSTDDLRTGARIYSVVTAVSSIGFVLAPPPWRYLCVSIAVVCFIRSLIYFRKLSKRPDK